MSAIISLGNFRDQQTLATSTKGDSESDMQDQTPDTDDSGAHSYPGDMSKPPHSADSHHHHHHHKSHLKKQRSHPAKEATTNGSQKVSFYNFFLLPSKGFKTHRLKYRMPQLKVNEVEGNFKEMRVYS